MINAALAEVLDEQEGELDLSLGSQFGGGRPTAGSLPRSVRRTKRRDRSESALMMSSVRRVVTSHAQPSPTRWVQPSWTGAGPPTETVVPTAWEAVHHLADRLIDGGGELEAAKLMARLGSLQDPAMALAYRLHDIAAKKGRTADQERYNALINSWAELVRLSGDSAATTEGLF